MTCLLLLCVIFVRAAPMTEQRRLVERSGKGPSSSGFNCYAIGGFSESSGMPERPSCKIIVEMREVCAVLSRRLLIP